MRSFVDPLNGDYKGKAQLMDILIGSMSGTAHGVPRVSVSAAEPVARAQRMLTDSSDACAHAQSWPAQPR